MPVYSVVRAVALNSQSALGVGSSSMYVVDEINKSQVIINVKQVVYIK